MNEEFYFVKEWEEGNGSGGCGCGGILRGDLDANGYRILNVEPPLGTLREICAGDLLPLFRTIVCEKRGKASINFKAASVGDQTFYGNVSGASAPPKFTAIGKLFESAQGGGLGVVVPPASGGLPVGGDAGAVLKKATESDFDSEWVVDPPIEKIPNLGGGASDSGSGPGVLSVGTDGTLYSGPNWGRNNISAAYSTSLLNQWVVPNSGRITITQRTSGLFLVITMVSLTHSAANAGVVSAIAVGNMPFPAAGPLPTNWGVTGGWDTVVAVTPGWWYMISNMMVIWRGGEFGILPAMWTQVAGTLTMQQANVFVMEL